MNMLIYNLSNAVNRVKQLYLCTVLIFVLSFSAWAQKESDHWFFGTYLGMDFQSGAMKVVKPDASPMYAPYGCSAASDPVTGTLKFYTNGVKVYDRMHNEMPNGASIMDDISSAHSIIVPDLFHPGLYYIFTSGVLNNRIRYAIVDMTKNNGMGDVTKNEIIGEELDLQFTMVKQLYDEGYWLITHRSGYDQFYCFRIGRNGFEPQPVISSAGVPSTVGLTYTNGKMVASSSGEQLMFTHNNNSWGGCSAQLFSFDKRCGLVTKTTDLEAIILQAELISAFPAFSPDGKLLYISWCYNSGQNFILQYNLASADPNLAKHTVSMNINGTGDLQLAPDKKIYITSADNGNVTSKISVIDNPDNRGTACGFRYHAIDLAPNTNYYVEHFPEFMMDNSPQKEGYKKPEIHFSNQCADLPVIFSLADSFTADSFRWHFGDGSSSADRNPSHDYSFSKNYPVTFRWHLCEKMYEMTDTLRLGEKPLVELGHDTILCSGSAMLLKGPASADEYRWSTTDSSSSIIAGDAGLYTLSVRNGNCWNADTIRISYHPPLWIALGDEYFICDRENELIKLDAGEGFQHYQWDPTGDTTQWIIVAALKDYFVVVKDFRGCAGDDGTTVKRRCPVQVYFPNAFTPNNDGINDYYAPAGTDVSEFYMSVYNRWGEKIFETNSMSRTWDGTVSGKPAQSDTYVYKASYKGYINKRVKNTEVRGTISLIR